jgi:hypothetical protein
LFGGDVTASRKISSKRIVGVGDGYLGAIRDIRAKSLADGNDRNRRSASDDGEAQHCPPRLGALSPNVVRIRRLHHWNIRTVVGR